MAARQDSDNLAWDRSDELWEEKRNQIRLKSTTHKIVALAERMFGGPVVFVPPILVGGFNVLYPIHVKDSSVAFPVLARLPYRTEALFHEEKTLAEVATVAYISRHTQLPVPDTLYHGIDPDVGPFMIIQDLGTRRDMCDSLQMPGQDPDESPILDPNISDNNLRSMYNQMARCLLQLAQPTFPCIGSLIKTSAGFDVIGRPITLNMSNMVQLSNIPQTIFPSKTTTYKTANDWYVALTEMQMATLLFQHNDIVSSENDCRTKYVARQLFRRLAKQGRLSTFGFAGSKTASATFPVPDGSNSFRLWPDDFRPANVLVNNEQIAGIIDWEFTYVGPTQFVLDPPWWLLIEVPEMWEKGIDDWASVYERRLETWLSEMEKAERDMSPGSLLLSAHMRESWKTGRFWLNYAARKSWAFDAIYWKYLDERFFGKRDYHGPTEELWKSRVHLLSEQEQMAMESLVQIKMEESKERILVDWEAAEARQLLSSFLFD
ncbi:hypothetical protein BKA67DRAFT_522733 [Truncatella angustata]|uniref:Phosphotransferase n=1 Tax=Truncatella angustata TaxID=152316 RepID=A0A9P8ZTF6_9PEZI|nr:uncharacterized protein BKA67DRAFT_522733 [Truncatella angustata]KAH6648935.1 hypothetical protein BKA67DRAFT_522733 [Truncatella angustata]KAH8198597.1 hypothetical protein TruAng_007229 [Truncatella angustata]